MNETEDRFLVSEVCYKLGSRTYISLLSDTTFDILSHGQGVKKFIFYTYELFSHAQQTFHD